MKNETKRFKIFFLEADGRRLGSSDSTFLSGKAEVEYFDGALDENEMIDKCAGAHVVSPFIYSQITRRVIESLPNLRLIAARSAGCDHIDVAAAKERGIEVQNVPAYAPEHVAEHAFALLLAGAKRLRQADAAVRKGDFSYKNFESIGLKEKTLGIVGTGQIGRCVARIAKAFGMRMLAYDIIKNPNAAKELGFQYVSLKELLKNSDFITLHVPLTKTTYHLIDKSTLAFIKRGCVLINTSRGAVVDTAALVEGLENKIFSAACLDVLEGEPHIDPKSPLIQKLLQAENVVITPHTAFHTNEAMKNIWTATLANIENFMKNFLKGAANDKVGKSSRRLQPLQKAHN